MIPQPILSALAADGFSSDAHADECIRLTRYDLQSQHEELVRKEEALEDMQIAEAHGESAIAGLKDYWT